MRNTTRFGVKGRLAIALAAFLPAVALAEPLTIAAGPDADGGSAVNVATPNPLNAVAPSNGKILILPFQPVNPNDPAPWLGKSIQESMASDLTVAVPDRVIVSDQPAATLDAAVAMGKQRGARYVVAGGFLTVDRELRITGQVVDVETGKPITGLKATGEPSSVFQLEDTLGRQVRAQVLGGQLAQAQAPPTGDAAPVLTPIPQAQLDAQPAPQPDVVVPTPAPDATGLRTDYFATVPAYTSYAVAPTPPVYGTTYYPGYNADPYGSGYAYYYPAYYASPFCDFSYYPSFGCFPFGLSFCFGGGFHNHFHFDSDRFVSRGRGFRNSSSFGSGVSFASNVGTRGFSGGLNFAARSPAMIRGSGGSSFSARNTFSSARSFAPTRAPAFYSRGSISAAHAGSFGGGFHSFGGGGSFHSFGGGGGMGHGGGGHR